MIVSSFSCLFFLEDYVLVCFPLKGRSPQTSPIGPVGPHGPHVPHGSPWVRGPHGSPWHYALHGTYGPCGPIGRNGSIGCFLVITRSRPIGPKWAHWALWAHVGQWAHWAHHDGPHWALAHGPVAYCCCCWPYCCWPHCWPYCCGSAVNPLWTRCGPAVNLLRSLALLAKLINLLLGHNL